MTDNLTGDDPLWRELYDVRREAEAMGNLIAEDVAPKVARLRAQAPVHRGYLREILNLPPHFRHALAQGKPGFSALSFEAVQTAFRDPRRFSSRIAHHPNPENEQKMGVLEMDGPQHRSYRRILQPRFQMAEAVAWWRTRFIDEIVTTLIDRLHGRDRAELNLEMCARIPVHTITRAIGLTGEEALVFRDAWTKSSPANRDNPVMQREAAATVERMLLGLIAARRTEPEDDLISYLLSATLELQGEDARPLTDREIMNNARLVMVAGGGTTWRQMGITLFALLTHRDQLEEVMADRALLDAAIEESLRWNPTAAVFSRMVVEATEFFGLDLPAGGVIELSISAANRDPAQWENPDAYDMRRPPRTNLAFGIGQHRCLGMNVAKSEISVALNALFDAFPRVRLDPDAPAPFMTGGLEQRGVSGLPVLLR